MKDSYYADTAYDSLNIKELPAPDSSKFSFTTRKLRRHPLRRFIDVQCGEPFSITYIQIIDQLKSNEEELKKAIASPGEQIQPWETLRNPKVLITLVTKMSGLIAACFLFGLILMLLIALWNRGWAWFQTLNFLYTVALVVSPAVVYLIGRYLQKKDIFEDRNNVILNRRKGTILIPRKNSPNQELPFEEFDPYLNHSAHSSGRICYHLCLCHRYSEEWISYPEEQEDEWGVYQLWEFWQQYMDISKPLPDVPEMEPYRSRDPVTAAYDKKHNRPKDYWKNMDMEKADQMHDASINAAKQYPWGKTREQALSQGWQPSGCGEGDWQQDTRSEK